jgi:DNA-binding NtrC family response regulator
VFERGNGGTVFLDEIGELALDLQPKLLRLLEQRRVRRVGGAHDVPVDVRVIAATNRDLEQEVAEGRFREDLYFRISAAIVRLPPLRERREDLPGRANMFLAQFSAEAGSAIDGFSSEALAQISRASWPGNVRQLQNTIQRAVIMSDGAQIRPGDLHGLEPVGPQPAGTSGTTSAGIRDPESPERFLTKDGHIRRLLDIEADVIALAMTMYRGRMSETARRLGIGRSTLYRKIDELRLDTSQTVQ